MNIGIIIVGAIILALIFLAKEIKGLKNWGIFALVILITFLLINANFMVKSGELNFNSPKAIISSIGVYMSWIGETSMKVLSVGKDTIKTMGNVIKNSSNEKDD